MDYRSLNSRTVVELRRLAKERSVKLPAGSGKAVIIGYLLEAEKADRNVVGKPEKSEPVVRKATENAPVRPRRGRADLQKQESAEPTVKEPETPVSEPCAERTPEQRVYPRRSFVRRQPFVREDRPFPDKGSVQNLADPPVCSGEDPKRAEEHRKAPEVQVCPNEGYVRPAETPVRRDNYELTPEGIFAGGFADGSGLLELQQEGSFGVLRAGNCQPGSRDIYISIAQIRRFGLKPGDLVEGKVRPPREGDRYGALIYISKINGEPPEKAVERRPFESLVPVYPDERLRMETAKAHDLSLRMIDLLAPVGKGQRGMIVSPPKAGKTTLLKKIANAISDNNPEVKLMVLLIDERPEEVTDMKRSIRGDVVWSTFDEAPENHIRVAEMMLEHAQRMVEAGKDVVILMDSITRLARAYNLVIPPTGRSLSGGLDPGALHRPKRFFGAARNIENGGSLTIIATALVDTGSRMDDIIYEEFKGTGNMELHLDRRLSDRHIFPAIDPVRSGTRREELLQTEEEREGAFQVRRMLSGGNAQQNAEQLIGLMEKSADNAEFFRHLREWTAIREKESSAPGGKQ